MVASLKASDHSPASSTGGGMPHLRIGDVVFIRIGAYPFRQVAAAPGSWTNHVGIDVGMRGGFRELLAARPDVDLRFWRAWYFGSIPWKRQTVTPASLLASPELDIIFDSVVGRARHRAESGGLGAHRGATSC